MMKDWVIPDVHACANTLMEMIETHIQPTSDDNIYLLGDYIDRGPNGKAVIDYLIQLKKDGVKLRCLMGNHEEYCIKAARAEKERSSFFGFKSKNKVLEDWLRHGAKETLDSFKVQKMNEFPEYYLDWMRKLEMYVELDNFLLVHAGFNFDKDDIFSDERAMLWVREYKVDLNKTKQKKVIHGHVPVSLDFIELQLRQPEQYPFIALDNGVYMTRKQGHGNLVALELNEMNLKVQRNIDFL